jgi:tubulin polyglutamylase TTLL11
MSSKPLRVNTRWSKGTHEVLQLVLSSTKSFKEIPTCGDRAAPPGDVVWVVSTEDLDIVVPRLKSKQWLSRIPGMADLCKKVNTCLMFKPYVEKDPDSFDFLPTTWMLPGDLASLMATLESKRPPTVIFKPSEGSQGDGIYLLQGKRDVCRRIDILSDKGNGAAVVQKYIRHPFLFEGLKFDFRLYAVIMDVGTGESYLCREGLVRFCTTPYDAPTARNLHHCTMHLTNYSLNKMSKEFAHDDAGGTGSKRLLTVFMGQLAAAGVDVASVWDSLIRLTSHTVGVLCKTITLTQPTLPCKAFHVVGLDVLLDKNLKPYLLEINNNPSMRVDATHTIESGALPPPGKKPCRCMSHYMPHVHVHSAVDVTAKSTVTNAVLTMLQCRKSGMGADEVVDAADKAGMDVVPTMAM